MLHFVCRYPALTLTVAYDGAFGNIIIKPVNIGVCMMKDVVFLFPEKCIGTHSIH